VIEKAILIVDDHPASRMVLTNFLKAKELKAPTGKGPDSSLAGRTQSGTL
jgi:CheY-like chemotaxis protein